MRLTVERMLLWIFALCTLVALWNNVNASTVQPVTLVECSLRDVQSYVEMLLNAHNELTHEYRTAGGLTPHIMQQLHEIEAALSHYEVEVQKIQQLLA